MGAGGVDGGVADGGACRRACSGRRKTVNCSPKLSLCCFVKPEMVGRQAYRKDRRWGSEQRVNAEAMGCSLDIRPVVPFVTGKAYAVRLTTNKL